MKDNKRVILIADDEKDIRDIVSLLLTGDGYMVLTAEDGQKAVDMASPEIDLYILDVNMPHLSGIMAAAEIRKKHDTPIVFLTAYSSESDKVMGFSVGADDYIVSPVDEDIVKESIFRFKNEDISNNIDYKILSIRSDDLSKVTNKIIKITNAEYNNGINLKKISKMIDLNSADLGRVFLKETGIKYSEYLMLYRLHKAKNMIIMSSENISKIANKVGYTNSNYFYIHFNKTFGISPSDFRNNVI